MGVLKGPIKREPVDVVWHGDKDVKVPDHLKGAGWIDASLCECSSGADVVTIRAMDDDAKTAYDDRAGRPGTAMRYALSAGIRAVNGKTKGVAEWRKALVLENPTAASWLEWRILAETAGRDPKLYYAYARVGHGYDPEPEEVADAGASKSGGND